MSLVNNYDLCEICNVHYGLLRQKKIVFARLINKHISLSTLQKLSFKGRVDFVKEFTRNFSTYVIQSSVDNSKLDLEAW